MIGFGKGFKLFDFKEVPVTVKLPFFALFLFAAPSTVFVLFVAILVHELAHTYIAHRRGYKTKEVFIGLFFGGAAVDESVSKNDKDNIAVSIAGPVSNILLGAISFVAMAILMKLGFNEYDPVINILAQSLLLNLLLGASNLLPISILDGGRIATSLINLRVKNLDKSEYYASYISMAFLIPIIVLSIMNSLWIILFFSAFFGVLSVSKIVDYKKRNG